MHLIETSHLFKAQRSLARRLLTLGLGLSLTGSLPLWGAQLYAEGGSEQASRPYQVATSTYPIYVWARALLQDIPSTQVELLTPPDQDPALWVPSAEALTRYQRSSLIALNGAQFEQWLAQVSLPPSRTLETAEPLRAEWLHYQRAVQHQHGPEGEHSHEGVDGHTWLDPLSALKQSEALYERLKRDLPQHERALSAHRVALERRLRALDAQWRAFADALRAAQPSVVIWASHPAYQYLARRYSLPITSLDLSPEEPIKAEALKELMARRAALKSDAHLVLWWEATPTEQVSEALAPLKLTRSITVPPFETEALSEPVREGREPPAYFERFGPLFERLKATLP